MLTSDEVEGKLLALEGQCAAQSEAVATVQRVSANLMESIKALEGRLALLEARQAPEPQHTTIRRRVG